MTEVCDSCIEISKMELEHWWRKSERREWKIQCPECGAWWEMTFVKRTRFTKGSDGWHHYFGLGIPIYVPIECKQRRCKDQAKHKVSNKGKRKWKCDKHAGVCIIA
jgi:ssDNA-binding Zn-finger/Zn-ribbon topoisomerase 1